VYRSTHEVVQSSAGTDRGERCARRRKVERAGFGEIAGSRGHKTHRRIHKDRSRRPGSEPRHHLEWGYLALPAQVSAGVPTSPLGFSKAGLAVSPISPEWASGRTVRAFSSAAAPTCPPHDLIHEARDSPLASPRHRGTPLPSASSSRSRWQRLKKRWPYLYVSLSLLFWCQIKLCE
jgi:hypothetical protein